MNENKRVSLEQYLQRHLERRFVSPQQADTIIDEAFEGRLALCKDRRHDDIKGNSGVLMHIATASLDAHAKEWLTKHEPNHVALPLFGEIGPGAATDTTSKTLARPLGMDDNSNGEPIKLGQHVWMHERGNQWPWLLRPINCSNRSTGCQVCGWWRAASDKIYTLGYLQTLREAGDCQFVVAYVPSVLVFPPTSEDIAARKRNWDAC